jgi:putative ABC transport system ATP-binding protein
MSITRLIRHADRVIAMEDGMVRDDRRQNETVESAP